MTVLPETRRRRRWPGLLVVLVLLAAGWSGLWWFAAGQANAEVDRWMAAERQAGRNWTCDSRQVVGFPLTMKLRCNRLTFRGEVAGRASTGNIEGVLARVGLDSPRTLSLSIKGPMHLRADNDDYDLAVNWTGLHLTAGDLPEVRSRGTLAVDRLAINLRTPDDLGRNLRVGHLDGQAEPGSEPGATAFAFSGQDVKSPDLDDVVGEDAAVAATGRGELTRTNLLSAPTVRRLEAWRQAGGSLHVADLQVGKGGFSGRASGTLALDEEHRMAGRLDASLAGFGPLAQRFGIPVAGVKLGGFLSKLLGGKAPAAAETGGADKVNLALTFADGRLSVGPFVTPLRLNPLYDPAD